MRRVVESSSIRLRGTAAAPGVAVGPVWRYAQDPRPADAGGSASTNDPATSIRAAAATAARELAELAGRVRELGRADDAGILEAQGLMAVDPMVIDEAVRRAEGGEPPAAAVQAAAAGAAEILAGLDDELLAARAADVRDVGARIVRILTGEELALPNAPSIVFADDLPPSVAAEIPAGFLLGVVLGGGSRTAHSVILARGRGIPAVIGVADLLEAEDRTRKELGKEQLTAAIDGETGEVVLDPGSADADEFRSRAIALAGRRGREAALRDMPAATADGDRVLLVANIGSPADVPRALEARAEGVGLFRTEFLFMKRQTPPTEAEQAAAYREVLEAFGPNRPVVIRLADIGGDKVIPYLGLPVEANPFLGVRAIRLAYQSPGLLRTQLRALWRAGALANVVPHVMAPMVATVSDVELFLSLRDEARASLVAAGTPVANRMVTGIMVEVPSAAILSEELARLIDFFSIGTNDLTQYLLAADRGNSALGRLQDALHPAVLRTIAAVVRAADAAGIGVAVCGELAGDPLGALVLVGLGVDELSADPSALDAVRAVLARVTRGQLTVLARDALGAVDAETVRSLASVLARPGSSAA